MISSIEWIPKGCANPNPKKYKLSKAESEFLEQVTQNKTDFELSLNDDDPPDDEMDPESENNDESFTKESLETDQRNEKIQKLINALPTVDPATLPEELRMGEYSDDEDDEDDLKEHRIGRVLLGPLDPDDNHEALEDLVGVKQDDEDEDEDDSLDDVPDTREYIPTDVKGLGAMRFSGYNGIADYQDDMDEDDEDDNGSDVEDTNLRPDDALILVAKTEEVCVCLDLYTIFALSL